MTFTKILVEPDEIPILETGNNIFLYAIGSSNQMGYHLERNSFDIDFSLPSGATYYNGFEEGDFPFVLKQGNPEWTTSNNDDADLVWELTAEKASSRSVYSIRSPALYNEEGTPGVSSATLTTSADWPAGVLYFSVLESVAYPLDNFQYTVDGVIRGQAMKTTTSFEEKAIQLSSGRHIIDFVYKFNPEDVPLPPPNVFPDRIGAVFIDEVYFVPYGSAIP
eukprot:CAMPEP_0181139762 /NCGR_PEP_ID=MMETSP1071-20121207/34953_1 /TAXON_ID=35127 /ORGANISM="Thalassiosira sp., Strain NH16" /LENGTH=220 /DNA_ID=CAMNT_0023226687 /DNA_START=383 /DNA_END=1045 /DNA_ORIENTATION=-